MLRRSLLACALTGALLLAACTGDDAAEEVPAAAPTPTAAPEEPAAEPVAEEEAPAEEDDAAAVDRPEAQAPPSQVLASVRIPVPSAPGAEVDMAVNSWEVRGDLLRVVMTYTADLPQGVDAVDLRTLAGQGVGGNQILPRLIDPVHLKEYTVVTGSRGTYSLSLQHGEPRSFAYYYAAPADPVESFDVQLRSDLPLLVDVPYAP
jgi:hypothetical protein